MFIGDMNESLKVLVNRWMDGWVDRWINAWMNG